MITFQRQRVHAFCWGNRNDFLINTRRKWKWKITDTVLERCTLRCSLYKNCELKVKLWGVGVRERTAQSYSVYFVWMNFLFNIWVLSQFIVYGTNFQNIYTSTYQKPLHYTTLLFAFKIVESLPCIIDLFDVNC